MEVLVLDTNFGAIDVVDSFDSLIWAERYSKFGDFEIYTPVDAKFLLTLQPDYYLWLSGSEQVMIVEGRGIITDPEEGCNFTFVGRSLESILDRRIIWAQTILNGNFQLGVRQLLNENAISPTDQDRTIPGLLFEMSIDPAITALDIQAQFNGDNLYDAVQKLCDTKGIGFKITLTDPMQNLINEKQNFWEAGHYATNGAKGEYATRIRLNQLLPVLPLRSYSFKTNNPAYCLLIRSFDSAGNFVRNWSGIGPSSIKSTLANEYYLGVTIYDLNETTPYATLLEGIENGDIRPFIGSDDEFFKFELYAGADRSYDQIANPYIVFSPKFDNLSNSNYAETKKALKTITLVAGEGEGINRKTATVAIASGGGSGLSRREMFTDARDISSIIDGGTLTAEEYDLQLAQRGSERLSTNTFVSSFDGQADTTTLYNYGVDFFMGDILQIANEYGMEAKTRVTELIRSQNKAGEEVYPTFEAVE